MTEGEPSSLARFYRAGGAEPRLAEHYRLPAASPALRRSRSIVTEALTPEQCLRAANWLLASSFLSTFAMSLTMQATTEIWLGHFAGDFTRHARRMTSLGTLSSVLGFFIKPLLASLSDAHGRVPLLFLSPSVNLVLTTLMSMGLWWVMRCRNKQPEAWSATSGKGAGWILHASAPCRGASAAAGRRGRSGRASRPA